MIGLNRLHRGLIQALPKMNLKNELCQGHGGLAHRPGKAVELLGLIP